MSETVATKVTAPPVEVVDPITQFTLDDFYGETPTNIQNVEVVNELIRTSKGQVVKEEITFDGNFIKTTGNSTEYLKLNGGNDGMKYWPGAGWYKFNIRDEL